MKKLACAAAILAAAIGTARAADAPPAPSLTTNDCLIILQGLNGLDGHQIVVAAGKPNEAVATVPYEFGSARLRLSVATNMAALGNLQRDVQTAQQKMVAEIGKGSDVKPNTPEMTELTKQVADLMNQPCRIQLARLKAEDLKLDKNDIPSSVVAALDKILDK